MTDFSADRVSKLAPASRDVDESPQEERPSWVSPVLEHLGSIQLNTRRAYPFMYDALGPGDSD